MGRYDFRPSRVQQAASQLLATGRLKRPPPWYDTVSSNPPSQILVRTQPQQHTDEPPLPPHRRTKKASKQFRPQRVVYEEDALRAQFFKDHPWELARPRMVLEDDGRDGRRADWSQVRQPGRALDGESVVQRQLCLLRETPDMTPAKAYDAARREFYAARLAEDVARRVAREEAESTGAYFAKSALEVGMELEDKAYEHLKEWAIKENEALSHRRAGSFTGVAGAPERMAGAEDPGAGVDGEAAAAA